MEKSYLDPDTARKIGTVKQQLRIQKDRRSQLTTAIQESSKNIPMSFKEASPRKKKK